MATRLLRVALAAVLLALPGHALAGENLLVNPGFDGSIAGWEVRGAETAYNALDAAGAAGSGSGRTFEGEAIHQCVPVQGGRVFDFAASAFIPPGQTRSAPATAGVRFGTGCEATAGLSFSVGVSSAAVGSWTRLAGRAYAPVEARFAVLSLSIGKAGPGDVLFGLFDDALLAESPDRCSPVWAYPLLTTTPGARSGMAMAYDASRRRMLLYGGFDGTSHKGDTWTWDGAAWREEPGAGPDERTGTAAVHDGARERVLLFGGVRTGAGTVSVRSDTWEWDGAWMQRAVSGPPGRHQHAMAYDAGRGRVVLFGGASASGMLGDTWEWDGAAWREVPVAGEKPAARLGHGLAYDARRGRVVLFGGVRSSGGPSDETWEWDGASWTRIEHERRPSARYGAGMAYDSTRGEIVLHGGAGVGGALPAAEVWRLGESGWSVEGSLGTLQRAGPALAYDPARRRMVLYGGATATGQPLSVTVERVAGAPVERLVPIVLDVRSGTAHFTTELALTNRGTAALDAELRYTAALGELAGSGAVTTSVPAGTQLVLGDTLAFLREKGLAIPGSGNGQQGGTLELSFGCATSGGEIGVTARTTTATSAPHPIGSAGLAYAADDLAAASAGPLTLYGLRANATDRSNVAVYSTSALPVTLRLAARSGGDGTSVPLADDLELAPWGWRQLSFGASGLANGTVTIERVGGSGTFGAYGVVNDNATNDGSFLLARRGGTSPSDTFTVPVLVETPSFRSELVLASSAEASAALELELVEALSGASLRSGRVTVTLAPGEQRIVPDAVDFLRGLGAAIGSRGARSYAGALRVTVRGAPAGSVYAAARTASQSPGGGQFGLFTAPVRPEEAAAESAVLDGLRADSGNRSNVALAHLGGAESGPLELTVQAFDGAAGGTARGEPVSRTLAPGQWAQLDGFLANAGVANGWVVIRRTAGTAPWLAYGVVNDGGAPGERTGDGAYVPMTLPR